MKNEKRCKYCQKSECSIDFNANPGEHNVPLSRTCAARILAEVADSTHSGNFPSVSPYMFGRAVGRTLPNSVVNREEKYDGDTYLRDFLSGVI